jgi:predicted nucleic acid-binding Zn ribbon protein
MGFDSLLDILRKVQRENPKFAARLAESEALSRWETAVGPQIAKHTRAVRVQDKTLFVEVDHPIWKQELQHRKRQILDLLNHGRPQGDGPRQALPPARETIEDLFFMDARGGGAVRR